MNQQLDEGEEFLNSYKLMKKMDLGNIPMIIEGIPIREHTQDPDISSISECIEVKISTKLGSKKKLDASIMTRLSSLSMELDSCIKKLSGYIIELDEARKRHNQCKLKMKTLTIIKNKALAQVIKSFIAYKANLTYQFTTPTNQREILGDISDHS